MARWAVLGRKITRQKQEQTEQEKLPKLLLTWH